MRISSPIHGYRKISNDNNSKYVVQLNNVNVASSVIQCDHMRYMNIHIGKYNDVFNRIEAQLKEKINGSIHVRANNVLFVKLPFRYGRYQIRYQGLSSSEDFTIGKIINCQIELCGVKYLNDIYTCCFKLVEFEAI